MGRVFLAQDESLDRRVALKLLAAKLEGDETAKKRFLREAKSSAALDHPRAVVPEKRAPTLSMPRLGRKRFTIGAAALAALTLVAALVLWWNPSDGRSPARDGPPSVAVLPLTNISEDPLESDYLAAGISQAVTNKLTQVGLRG